jgi:hypothetical protein
MTSKPLIIADPVSSVLNPRAGLIMRASRIRPNVEPAAGIWKILVCKKAVFVEADMVLASYSLFQEPHPHPEEARRADSKDAPRGSGHQSVLVLRDGDFGASSA